MAQRPRRQTRIHNMADRGRVIRRRLISMAHRKLIPMFIPEIIRLILIRMLLIRHRRQHNVSDLKC